jgi:hypothetical protein
MEVLHAPVGQGTEALRMLAVLIGFEVLMMPRVRSICL